MRKCVLFGIFYPHKDQKQAVLTRGKNVQNTIFYPTVYRFCRMSKSASDRQSLSRHLLTGYSTLSLMNYIFHDSYKTSFESRVKGFTICGIFHFENLLMCGKKSSSNSRSFKSQIRTRKVFKDLF